MLPALVALGVGAVLAVTFWDEIVNWLEDFIPKVEQVFRDIAHGAQMLGEKIRAGYVAIKHKVYWQENNKWMEQTTTREVEENEVPPHIREKIMKQKKAADITKELAPMLLS
ncbi:MAG: hypothetical protein J6M62_02165 [Selenomonadaceae bacterium]|nr:hypothetical protein [Selenomonadaceae bacterium]